MTDLLLAVRPLIAREVFEEGALHVAFRCPVSGATWIGSTTLDLPAGTVAVPEAVLAPAVLRAWHEVQHHFTHDDVGHRLVARAALTEGRSDLARLLSTRPVRSRHGREAAARAMAGVASVSGVPTAAARELYLAFASEAWPLDRALALPELDDAALADVPLQEHATVLAVALAVGWAEGAPDELQALRLDRYRRALGIAPSLAVELSRAARDFVLEQALGEARSGAPDARARLHALVEQSGLEPESLAALSGRVTRRHG